MANLINLCCHSPMLIVVCACLSSMHLSHSFTIDLIHRNSPQSPLYNPHETPAQRLQNAIKRSRFHSLTTSSIMHGDAAESDVISDNGGFLMKLSIGNPPMEFYGILDTGSDLLWLKCLSPQAGSTNRDYPVFNPKASSSYRDIQCGDKACNIPAVNCSGISKLCSYSYGYAGGDYTKGVLAMETVTFQSSSGKRAAVNDITFGCSLETTAHNTGLIGLSLGTASFINQIGTTFGARKFSHCFVPFHNPHNTSKLILGSEAIVSGPGTIRTPLVNNDPGFYSFTLNGISVNSNFIPYSNSSKEAQKGNMIIDSGSTQPVLPLDFYNRLTTEVKKSISLKPFIDDGKQLCYKSSDHNFAPTFTAHFDGADLELKSINVFIPQYPDEDLFCYGITHNEPPWTGGVYGNFFQYDYLMGFDIDNMMLSIKPTDCTL